MTAIPSNLALTNIADGADIVASDHRNNYSAIQTGWNSLMALLGSGTSGQVLLSGGPTALSFGSTIMQVTKTTSKTWNTSSAESTDLLNAEIALPQNIGTTASWELELFADVLNNTGGANTFTWRVKVGSGPTVLWALPAVQLTTSATRRSVDFTVKGMNLGAANSQVWKLHAGHPSGSAVAAFTTGEGEEMDGFGGTTAAGIATSAIDTSAATTPIVVTVQHSSALATAETKLIGAVLKVKQS